MFVLADATTPAVAAMMSAIIGTALIVTVALTVLFVWMFWRVFAKAGFPGALGLLCLIPSLGWFICLIILAFSTWPNERVAAPVVGGTMPTTM